MWCSSPLDKKVLAGWANTVAKDSYDERIYCCVEDARKILRYYYKYYD